MARLRPSAPKRIWSRPTSASSSPSPRNTSTADFTSWTSSKRAISASCVPPTSSNTVAVTSFRPTPPGGWLDGWVGDDWFHFGAFRQQNMQYIYEQVASRDNSVKIGRAHVLNSSHLGISYAVFCL